MTNQWLKDQALVSVKELWVNIYPPGGSVTSPKGGIGSVNRPVRLPDLGGNRMQGVDPTLADVARHRRVNVGRGSSKLPFTRLGLE